MKRAGASDPGNRASGEDGLPLGWRCHGNTCPVNVDENADHEEGNRQVAAAVADERKGHSLVRKQRGGHPDIDRCLQGDQQEDAHGQKFSKTVPGIGGDKPPAQYDQDKPHHNPAGSQQSEFLADHGENEIGMRIRKIKEFLASVSKPQPFNAAGSESDQRLPLLESFSERVAFGMQETRQSGTSLGNQECGAEQRGNTGPRHDSDEKEIHPGDETEGEGSRSDEGRRSEIDFCRDGDQEDGNNPHRDEESLQHSSGPDSRSGKPPRKKEDCGDLGDLARLEGGHLEVNPPVGTIELHPDVRDKAENQEDKGEGERDFPVFPPEPVINHGPRDAGSHANHNPEDIPLDKVVDVPMGFLGEGARAEQHDSPDADESGNRHEQNVDAGPLEHVRNWLTSLLRLLGGRRNVQFLPDLDFLGIGNPVGLH
jgi:hypothetical protein